MGDKPRFGGSAKTQNSRLPPRSTGSTGGQAKLKWEHNGVVEQLIRPTGLTDPKISIRKSQGQVVDLIGEIRKRAAKKERVLVTTLTKRMAEELANYLQEQSIKVHYLHSEIKTLDRTDILEDLRTGKYDVIVGINLLREGLDLPEVSLVAILDADKEGFLRSKTSLIQVMGRAARNVRGEVIMYADQITTSIKEAVAEIERRRKVQLEYNRRHKIKPKTVEKPIRPKLVERKGKEKTPPIDLYLEKAMTGVLLAEDREKLIRYLSKRMREAAQVLDFETAALIRDQIKTLQVEKG